MNNNLKRVYSDISQTEVRVNQHLLVCSKETLRIAEKRYWLMDRKLVLNGLDINNVVSKIFEAGGLAHFKNPLNQNKLYEYTVKKNLKGEHSYSCNETKLPCEIVNIELGEILYGRCKRNRVLFNRSLLFKGIFCYLLNNYLWLDYIKPKGTAEILRLVINKREYWFKSSYNRSGVLSWETLGFDFSVREDII